MSKIYYINKKDLKEILDSWITVQEVLDSNLILK